MSNNALTTPDKFLPPATQQLNTDLDYTRTNLYDLIETGQMAIAELSKVADQSQNARAYEVLGDFISKMGDLNLKLLDVSTKKKVLATEQPGEEHDTRNITNNLYLTTKDLGEMIANMQKKEKE